MFFLVQPASKVHAAPPSGIALSWSWFVTHSRGSASAMRISRLNLIIVSLLLSAGWARAGTKDVIDAWIGTWEGESKCTVPNSPCHDEHALYKISADKKDSAKLNVDGYKVVSGEAQFMGPLTCKYHSAHATLSCAANTARQDDWEFQISGDTMTGTLTMGPEKKLYRRISLRKAQPKEN